MPLEIERKFLVTGDGWRVAAHKVVPMAQGYLNDLAVLDRGEMRLNRDSSGNGSCLMGSMEPRVTG